MTDKIFKWVGIIFTIFIALGLVGSILGDNENINDTKVIGNISSNSSNSISKSDEINVETKIYKVGDIIEFDNRVLTVTKVQRGYDTGNQFNKPKKGKEFIKVSVKITNNDDEEISFNTFDFEVPKDDADLTLIYTASFWDDKKINIKL